MQQDKRPLFTLTVEEYKELNKTIQIDRSYLIQAPEPTNKEQRDIVFIDEARVITGYKLSTIYSKVSRREIPVLSTGRPLTFSREELTNWIKAGRPSVAEMMAELFVNEQNKKK